MLKTRISALIAGLAAATTAALAIAVPAQAAASVHYVALGDSYSSGVGAGSYIGSSGSCQRSTNAYPQLWANANAPTSYVSVACSGATTKTVISGQLSALTSSTTLVSITIGGNDVGFANIMTTCALFGTTECVNAIQAAENKARAELAGLLNPVYNGIRSRAPQAKVVVLGYPTFYQLKVPLCIGLSEQSRTKINEGIDLIDSLTSDVARQHGFIFADVRSNFVGHQLCSGDKWLHALNFADIGISYHPMASGHSGGYLPAFKRAVA